VAFDNLGKARAKGMAGTSVRGDESLPGMVALRCYHNCCAFYTFMLP